MMAVDNGEEVPATVDEFRSALYEAQRALMHAEKRTVGPTLGLVRSALLTVSRTLATGSTDGAS